MKKARLLIYLCALLVCTVVGGVDVSAATEVNIIRVDAKDNINIGDNFTLTLTFNSTHDSAKINIASTSFYISDNIITRDLVANETNISIPLECKNLNDNKITLTFNYTDDTKSSSVIALDLALKSNTDSSSTVDTAKKYKPELVIVNEEVPVAIAGKDLNLDLEIKNASTYTAKNITVEFLPSKDEGFKYETNTISLVDKVSQLRKNETEKLAYSFLIKDTTVPKTYTCQLKYTYTNLYGDTTEKTQDIYIKVKKGYPSIDLAVTDIKTTPTVVKSGVETTLSLAINNNGGMKNVSKVNVSLEGLDTKTIALANGVNDKAIYGISPMDDGKIVTFNLLANHALTSGSYPLTVVVKYQDSEYKEQEIKKQIFLNVEGSDDTGETLVSDISIVNVTAPTRVIKYGNTFEIGLDVVNTGEANLRDISVTAKGTDEAVMIPMSQNVQVVESLAVGEQAHLTYKFQATDTAKSQNYPIRIDVKGIGRVKEKGTDKDQPTPVFSQYVGISIQGKPEDKNTTTSKPIVIISKYVTDPKIVKAGENYNLQLTFQNTHATKTAKNIVISFSAEKNQDSNKEKAGSVFTPVDMSSTFHIPEIKPGETSDKELVLYTIPFAAANVHDLAMTIYYEYEGANGETLTEERNDAVRATVVQPSSFITSDINIPEMMFVMEPLNISLEISNTGKTTLDNFTVSIEGMGSSNSRQYLGNLERGQTTYYDVEIWAEQPGEVAGNLVFTYTKPDGKDEVVKKAIKTMAEEMQRPNFDENNIDAGNFPMPDQQPKKSNTKLYIIGGSIAGLIILIIIIVVIRKRKKKKELEFDE